jgi:hypothetical protein
MPVVRRALPSAGLALVVLLIAGFVSARLATASQEAARAEAVRLGETAAELHLQRLTSDLKNVENAAVTAASLAPLRSISDQPVDERTLADVFENEPWWKSVREEFPLYAYFDGSGRVAFQSRKSQGLAWDLVVDAARRKKTSASGLAASGESIFLTAAAVIQSAQLAQVIGIARPLERSTLADEGHLSAVLITDGKSNLAHSGTPTTMTLAGREQESPLADPSGAWSAVAKPIGSLWEWTYYDAAASQKEFHGRLMSTLGLVWVGALILASLGVAIGIRRARPALPATAIPPQAVGAFATSQSSTAIRPLALDAPVNPDAGNGQQFGRYTLLEKIGEGGMARVFVAAAYGAEGFRRLFVIKRLLAQLSAEQEVVNHFIDEARLGASLVHSNIVPVFDFGKVGNEYFFAQEFILGRNLSALRARSMKIDQKPLSAGVVLYAAREVLKALAYAHTRLSGTGTPLGIVHRDVSMNNIMISAGGEVKLLDFGIAKANDRRLSQTQLGQVKGNVFFMSPEQAQGLAVDARSDLFSLGLVMYACLAGKTLYEGTNTYELLARSGRGLTDDDWRMVRSLPEATREVLSRALQYLPDQRFSSAEEFAAAIDGTHAASFSEAAEVMQRLFGAELRSEEERFRGGEVPNPNQAAETPRT